MQKKSAPKATQRNQERRQTGKGDRSVEGLPGRARDFQCSHGGGKGLIGHRALKEGKAVKKGRRQALIRRNASGIVYETGSGR